MGAGLSVANSNHSNCSNHSTSSIPDRRMTRKATKSLTKPLYRFLKEESNLTLFAGYLSECFALENILFLERAICLYHVILDVMRREREKTADGNDDETKEAEIELGEHFTKQKCYMITFTYLQQIRADMDEMISKEDDPKRGILEVMKIIYHQFCSSEFDTEVNVSYGCKANLQRLFENQSDDQILAQLEGYQDMLNVFHFAIVECYNLCCSVYGFQFRHYVRKHSVDDPQDDKRDPEGLSTPLAS